MRVNSHLTPQEDKPAPAFLVSPDFFTTETRLEVSNHVIPGES